MFTFGFLGNYLIYLIILSVIITIIGFLLLSKKRNVEDDFDKLVVKLIKSNRMNSHFQAQNISSKTSNNDFSQKELQSIYERITDLEFEISKLKEKINLQNLNTIQSKHVEQIEVKQPEVRSEIFFISSPNADGSFDECNATVSYKEGATIYRFTKIGNNKAYFQIDNKEASILLALQYRDKRIDPVCDATNAFNQAKNISTIQQGEAELLSGKWVVNKKAKIKYEN